MLKDELFSCFKYIGIPFNELYRMPIRDRKYYIVKYNQYMEDKNNAMHEGWKHTDPDNDLGMRSDK